MADETRVKGFLEDTQLLYALRDEEIREFRAWDAGEKKAPKWPGLPLHKPLATATPHELITEVQGLLGFNRPRYKGQKGPVTAWLNALFDYWDDKEPFWTRLIRSILGYGRAVVAVGDNAAWVEAVAKADPEFQRDAKVAVGAPFFCRWVDPLGYYAMPDEWNPQEVLVRSYRTRTDLRREFGEDTVEQAWRRGGLGGQTPQQTGANTIEYIEYLDVNEGPKGTVTYLLGGEKVDERDGLMRYMGAPGWLTDSEEPHKKAVGLLYALYPYINLHMELIETITVLVHYGMTKWIHTLGKNELDQPSEQQSSTETQEKLLGPFLEIPFESRMEVLQGVGNPWIIQHATAIDAYIRDATKVSALIAGAADSALQFSYQREVAQAKFRQPLVHLEALATRIGRYALELAEAEHEGDDLPLQSSDSEEDLTLKPADREGYRNVRAEIRTSMPNNRMALADFKARQYGKFTTMRQVLEEFSDLTVEQFRDEQFDDMVDDFFLRQGSQRLVAGDLLGTEAAEVAPGEDLGPVAGQPSRGGAAGQQIAQVTELLQAAGQQQ